MVKQSVFSVLFDSLPFIISLGAIFGWVYKGVYNHSFIQKYSTRITVNKVDINNYIKKNINQRYKVHLTDFYIVDTEDDDYRKIHKPTKVFVEDAHKHRIIGSIFGFTITFSIQLIFVMMFELTSLLNKDSRLIFFKIIINTLTFLITIAQPFVIINLYVCRDVIPATSNKIKNALAIITFFVWLLILHKFGDILYSFARARDINSKTIFERKVSEVALVGISTLAVLSGIGSSSTLYRLISVRSLISKFTNKMEATKKKQISESDINQLIRSFNHSTSLLIKRKNDLNDILVSNSGTIYNNSTPMHTDLYNSVNSSPKKKFGGLINKVQSFASLSSLSLNKEKLEEQELNNEINSLRILRNNIYEDILKTISLYKLQQEQFILQKKILTVVLKWFNIFFGCYCIYRIFTVFFLKIPRQYWNPIDDAIDTNIIDDKFEDVTSSSRDALATTLAKLILSIFNIGVSEAQLIQQLSFILSGSLFVCSFSNVLNTFKSFRKFFPTFLGMPENIKNWEKHLIISELLGIYVISTALLIRTNLPDNLSHQISTILSLTGSTISSSKSIIREIEFIDRWFDKLFAISCICTVLLLVAKKYLDDEIENSYDEEMLIDE